MNSRQTKAIAARSVPGLPRDDDGPMFREPWEAHAFAMAVTLHGRGLFTWPEWAETLSAAPQVCSLKSRLSS